MDDSYVYARDDLIGYLEQLQGQLGLSDRAYAAALDLSPSAWTLYKLGQRGATLRLLRLAVRRFPEHRDRLVRAALAAQADEREPEAVPA